MKTWWDRFSAFVFFGSCVFIVVVLIFASMTLMSTPTSAATNELPGPVGRYQICPDAKVLKLFYMVDTCTGRVWKVEEEPRTWKWVAKIILQEAPQ